MSQTKKCKHCQSDIPKKAKVCPVCRKKQKSTVLGILMFIIGLFLLIGSCASMSGGSSSNQENINSSNVSETKNDEAITLDEFNQIETGMTYEEVVEIIGSEGTVLSETSVLDSTTTMYCWYADNGIANANVTISDGKVVGKAQIGLE